MVGDDSYFALGAIDGLAASGLPESHDDPLTRCERGMEFLKVTQQRRIERLSSRALPGARQEDRLRAADVSAQPVHTHLLLGLQGLPFDGELESRDGMTASYPAAGNPYRRIFLDVPTASSNPAPASSWWPTVRGHPAGQPALSYGIVALSDQGYA